MKKLLCCFGIPLVVVSVVVVLSTSRISAMESQSSNDLPVDDLISEHLFSFASLNEDTKDIPLVDIGLRQKKPVWDFNVGAAILTRGTQAGSTLLGERQVTPPFDVTPVLSGSDLGSNWAGGLDISGTRELSPSRRFDAVNVRYFDVQGLQSTAAVDVTGLVVGPAWPAAPPFARNGDGTASYRQNTNLFSFEANGVVYGSTKVDWLAGFRWIGMNETLRGVVPLASAQPPAFLYGAGNSLYGGQLGANIKLLESGRTLQVYCAPKAGLYLNQAVGDYQSFDNNVNTASNGFRNQLAFAGDVSVNARYRLTKAFSVKVGYQLLWLNGIAVAADQAEVMGPESVTGRAFDSSGSAFFHGALVGGNFVW